jgi:hypothetical protein
MADGMLFPHLHKALFVGGYAKQETIIKAIHSPWQKHLQKS